MLRYGYSPFSCLLSDTFSLKEQESQILLDLQRCSGCDTAWSLGLLTD